MTLTYLQRTALGLSGVTALGIGAYILAAPQVFYASYGISLGADPSLLSELRAPGASLAAFGGVMLAGLLRSAMVQPAMIAALTVFIAFPAGRLVGIAVDGLPSGSIVGALLLELAFAALCVFAFRPTARHRVDLP